MYKYKNVKTGRIIEVKSRLAGGGWEPLAENAAEAAGNNAEPEADETDETDEIPEGAEPEETAEPAGEEELEEVAPVQQDKEEKKNPEKPAGGAVIKSRKGK